MPSERTRIADGEPPMHPETSIICRECGRLVGGVAAGCYVRWVDCEDHAPAARRVPVEVDRGE